MLVLFNLINNFLYPINLHDHNTIKIQIGKYSKAKRLILQNKYKNPMNLVTCQKQ